MQNTGQFIVIEGLEGAGKSTAVEIIKQELNQAKIDFICTREPGGTEMAEQLRDVIKQTREETVSPQTELLLMYAARVQLVENVIKPALAQGKWVIGDRHNLSTLAYQGGGRGINIEQIQQLKTLVLGDFQPDATLFMDVEPEVGLARARARGELDRIEQEKRDFFDRARGCFLELLQQQRNGACVDANQSMQQVHDDVRRQIQSWIGKL